MNAKNYTGVLADALRSDEPDCTLPTPRFIAGDSYTQDPGADPDNWLQGTYQNALHSGADIFVGKNAREIIQVFGQDPARKEADTTTDLCHTRTFAARLS